MKKIEEYEEFDTIEENLKDYKKKRRKILWALLNVVGILVSIYQLALGFPRHVEQFFPGLVLGVPLNEGYAGLNLGIPAEGTRLIDGLEVDLAQLKEESGIYYHLVVPMTKQEAKDQLKKSSNFNKGQDWVLTPMYGYTLNLSYEEHKEYQLLFSSYMEAIKNDEIPIKTGFTNLIKELVECELNNHFEIVLCGYSWNLDEYYAYTQGVSQEVINRYKHEFKIKTDIFRFAVYKEYVQSKGYNLEDYLPDPIVLRLSFD
jgi:hypothetical protein